MADSLTIGSKITSFETKISDAPISGVYKQDRINGTKYDLPEGPKGNVSSIVENMKQSVESKKLFDESTAKEIENYINSNKINYDQKNEVSISGVYKQDRINGTKYDLPESQGEMTESSFDNVKNNLEKYVEQNKINYDEREVTLDKNPKRFFDESVTKEVEKYIEQNKINYEEREITQEPKRFFDESITKEVEKYIEQNRNNYEQHSFPTLEYSSAEEVNNIREFVDGIDLLIKDIDDLNNDSYEIRGSFGQAMAYSSDVCKDNMASLKRFAEENMTPALKQVGEYEANDVEIKRIIKPLVGDISKVKFMSDGTISVPNLNSPTDKYTVAKAEEFYKRNRNIKERLESLSNDRINKAS